MSTDELLAFAREAHGSNALYDRLPLTDVDELADVAPYYLDWLAHPRPRRPLAGDRAATTIT